MTASTESSEPSSIRHVAFFLSSLAGGGVERSTLTLARALCERGHRVDLVVCKPKGSMRDAVHPAIRLVPLRRASMPWPRLRVLQADPEGLAALLRPVLLPLKASTKIRYLPALAAYLKRERPDVLISAMTWPNLVSIWAQSLAGVDTRIAVSERNMLSSFVEHYHRKWRWRHLPALMRRTYPKADAIVAVANRVADDLASTTGIDRARVRTIYNPVVTPELESQAKAAPSHPWLEEPGPPIILGVGRLVPQKDFATLVRAFARSGARHTARLLIHGDGPERSTLEALARDLGVGERVSMPGWEPNPFASMSRAALFVLSSAWEGLPGVLIQAMACGCPVVSTDCEGGAAEILEHGVHGPLVPVGDDAAMASAIDALLEKPTEPNQLKRRARDFSLERAVAGYEQLLCEEGPSNTGH